MKKAQIKIFALSDKGPARLNNEDVWKIKKKENFFALADGMGGHTGGEIAAKETVDQLCYFLSEFFKVRSRKILSPRQIIHHLHQAIKNTNEKVHLLSQKKKNLNGMGTTLCCLKIYGDSIFYAHVGDSRIYLWRKDKIKQLTEDHSLINKLIHKGKITEINLSYKNIITKAIGMTSFIEPTIASQKIYPGDILLMCTDGLSDFVDEDKISRIIKSASSIQKMAKNLINEAKKNDSEDNITIIIMQVKELYERSYLS